jgi:hypothetical protein
MDTYPQNAWCLSLIADTHDKSGKRVGLKSLMIWLRRNTMIVGPFGNTHSENPGYGSPFPTLAGG